jgi:3-methyladenine DNA glycosylase AlkD
VQVVTGFKKVNYAMKIIQSKAEVRELLGEVPIGHTDLNKLADGVNHSLLQKKIRFPLLEFAAGELYKSIPGEKQTEFSDKIMALGTIGGNVLAGILLQMRLKDNFDGSHLKAIEYIIKGDRWYVCDIIGERVIGYSLLNYPEKTIPLLRSYTQHPDKWVVRSIGVATHYAVKKGLKKRCVEEVFNILLACAYTTEFHTKKGIGWGVKTISKFHPEITMAHMEQIETDPGIKQCSKQK